MAMRARPEDTIQLAVFEHLRVRGTPGIVFWHTPNGGKRNPISGAILRRLGMLAGVSDVLVLCKGRFCALELKAPGNTPDEAQLEYLDRVNAAGGYADWCVGLDKALAILEKWGILRGAA